MVNVYVNRRPLVWEDGPPRPPQGEEQPRGPLWKGAGRVDRTHQSDRTDRSDQSDLSDPSVLSDPSPRVFLPGSLWRAEAAGWVPVAPWGEALGAARPAPDEDTQALFFRKAAAAPVRYFRNSRPLTRLSQQAGNRFAVAAPLLVEQGIAQEVAPEEDLRADKKKGPLVYAAGTLWCQVQGMLLRVDAQGRFIQGVFPITESELRERFTEVEGKGEGKEAVNYLKLSEGEGAFALLKGPGEPLDPMLAQGIYRNKGALYQNDQWLPAGNRLLLFPTEDGEAWRLVAVDEQNVPLGFSWYVHH